MKKIVYFALPIALVSAMLLLMEASPALTCTYTGERVSGLHKTCYYDCAWSSAAITVGSHEVCPTTIRR